MTNQLVGSTPQPLATATQFQRRFPELCKRGAASDPISLAEMMVEATSFIEDTCDRRFAPFSGYYMSDVLRGIDPDDAGSGGSDAMTDIYGSLGMSQAAAYGATDLVRHMWLDQTAPHAPELWTYNIESITAYLTYGNTMPIDPGAIEPPQKDTGHTRLRLGTFVPVGTSVVVIYGGGYTVAIPASLQRLCLYQAAKFILLDNEPQLRKEQSFADIEAQLDLLLANWAKT